MMKKRRPRPTKPPPQPPRPLYQVYAAFFGLGPSTSCCFPSFWFLELLCSPHGHAFNCPSRCGTGDRVRCAASYRLALRRRSRYEPAHDRHLVWAANGVVAAAYCCCLHRLPEEGRSSDFVSPALDLTEKAWCLPASTSDMEVLWRKLLWHTTGN